MAQVQRRRATKSRAAVVRQSFRDYLIMALVVVLVVFAVIFVKRWNDRVPGTATAFSSAETFLSGVSVNGVELGGMTYEEGLAAVGRQIEGRLNSPINLHYGGAVYTITPAQLGARMQGVEESIALAWGFGHTGSTEQRRAQVQYLQEGNAFAKDCELEYDADKLDQFIQDVKVHVDVQPVNADIKADASQLMEVVPHKDGLSLEVAPLKAQVEAVIERGASADIQLQPQVWKPKYTTEMMNACTYKISEWKTDARSSDENRTKNIMRALKPFRMMIVEPDQSVHFNAVVGKRAIENGFFPAPEIVDGALSDGIGGGTCQASTTLFNALVRAGFTINERHQHTLRVNYCKPSQDSTVTDRGKDLVFTNDTEYPMYIFATASWTEARVVVYGMKPEYKIKYGTRIVQGNIPWDGFDVVPDTSRKFAKKPGQMVIKSEGKMGCITEGVRQYCDWDTGNVVKEETLYHDDYKPSKPVYYIYAETP